MQIIALVDKILATKNPCGKKEIPYQVGNDKGKADTTALEQQIDSLVYKLYGLTQEEIAVIEKGIKSI